VPEELQNKVNTSPIHRIQHKDTIPSVLNYSTSLEKTSHSTNLVLICSSGGGMLGASFTSLYRPDRLWGSPSLMSNLYQQFLLGG
jgi:hypothetical protein